MDDSSEDEVKKPSRLLGFMDRIRKFSSREELSNASNDEENSRGKRSVKEKQKKINKRNSVKEKRKNEESRPPPRIFSSSREQGQSSRGHVSEEESTDDEEFAIKVLTAANHCRKKHGVKKLRINKNMSLEAQERAISLASEKYLLDKNDERYGTNIYQATFDRFHPKVKAHEIINAWYSEIENYDYDYEPEDFHDMRNATQLLWKDSKEIGVGKATSPNGEILFVNVYFNPPGNIKGEFTEQIHSFGQRANLEGGSISDLSHTSSDSEETKDYPNKCQDTQKKKRQFLRDILGKIRKQSPSNSDYGRNKDQQNASYTAHRHQAKYVINKTNNDPEETEKKKGSFYVVNANELKQTHKNLRNDNSKVASTETLDYPLKMDTRQLQYQEMDTLPAISKSNDYPFEYRDPSDNNVECIFLKRINSIESDLQNKINSNGVPSETQKTAIFVDSQDMKSAAAENVSSNIESQDNDDIRPRAIAKEYVHVQKIEVSISETKERVNFETLTHEDKDISKGANDPYAPSSKKHFPHEDCKGGMKNIHDAVRTTTQMASNSLNLSIDVDDTKALLNYQEEKPVEGFLSSNVSCSPESCSIDKNDKTPGMKSQIEDNYERRTNDEIDLTSGEEKTDVDGVKGSDFEVLDNFHQISTEISHSGKCFDCKMGTLSDECKNKHNMEGIDECETINIDPLKQALREKLRSNEKNSGNLCRNGGDILENKTEDFENMVQGNEKDIISKVQRDNICSNEKILTRENSKEEKKISAAKLKNSIELCHIMSPSEKGGVHFNEIYDQTSLTEEESKIPIPEIVGDKLLSKIQVQPNEIIQANLGKSIWLNDKTNDTSFSEDDSKKDTPVAKPKMMDQDSSNFGIFCKISSTSHKNSGNISNYIMEDNIKNEIDNKDKSNLKNIEVEEQETFYETQNVKKESRQNVIHKKITSSFDDICDDASYNNINKKKPNFATGFIEGNEFEMASDKEFTEDENTSEKEASKSEIEMCNYRPPKLRLSINKARTYNLKGISSSSDERTETDIDIQKEIVPKKKINIDEQTDPSHESGVIVFSEKILNTFDDKCDDSSPCFSSEEEELNEYPSNKGLNAKNFGEDNKCIGVVAVEKRSSKQSSLITPLPEELISHIDIQDNDPSFSDNNDSQNMEETENGFSIIKGEISNDESPKIVLESSSDLTEESSFHCGNTEESTDSFDLNCNKNHNSKDYISLGTYESFDTNQNSKMATKFDASSMRDASESFPTSEDTNNINNVSRRFFSAEYDIKNKSKMKSELFFTFKEVYKYKSKDGLEANDMESEKETKENDSADETDQCDVSTEWNIRYKNAEDNQSKQIHGSDFEVSEIEILNKSTPFAIYPNVYNSIDKNQDKNKNETEGLSVITMQDRKIVSNVDDDSSTKLFPNLENSFENDPKNNVLSEDETDMHKKAEPTKTISSSSISSLDDEGEDNCLKENVIKPKVRTKVLLKKSPREERWTKSTPLDCLPNKENNSALGHIKAEGNFDDGSNLNHSTKAEIKENLQVKSFETISEKKSGYSNDHDNTRVNETEDKDNYKDLGELSRVSFLDKIKDIIIGRSNPTSGEESDDKEKFTKEEEMIIRRISIDQKFSVEEKRDSIDSVDKSFRRGNLLNLIERYIRRNTSDVSSDDVAEQNRQKKQNYRPKLIETNRERAICESSSSSSIEDEIMTFPKKLKEKFPYLELDSDDTEDEAYRNKIKFRNMSNGTLAIELREAIQKLKYKKEMENESDPNSETESKIGSKLEPINFKKAIVRFINIYRQNHHAEQVILDEKLSDLAMKRAKNLASGVFGSLPSDWGENIFTFGSPVYFSTDGAEFIVDSWYRRIVYYKFESDAETIDIRSGSFTQLVWKESKSVGIGWYEDRRENMTVLVAVFNPAGNIMGNYKDQIHPS